MNAKMGLKNGIIKAGQQHRIKPKPMIISSKRAIVIAVVIIIATLFARNTARVASETKTAPKPQPEAVSAKYTPSDEAWQALKSLTHNQNVWIRQLISCESGGNPGAINPKDKDNTPSYGLMQFKPGTFYGFAKQYKIIVSDFMNADQQIKIVAKMIADHENINWFTQFPACVAKYGQPPAN